eukprot:4356028-Karenia_brevis.AAC.1
MALNFGLRTCCFSKMKPAKSKMKKRRGLPWRNPGFLSKVKHPGQRQLPSDGFSCKVFLFQNSA